MTRESSKRTYVQSKWPFIYSVEVQTTLIFFFTVSLSLLAPFPYTVHENEHVNFIHDFIYGQLDRVQLYNTKFSSFVWLGLIYGPIKMFTSKFTVSPIKTLLIMRLFLSFLTVSCWRFLQRRISFNYGSKVAFIFFLSEIFNWNCLNQSSRFVESNLMRSIIMLIFGLLIEKKFLFSLGLICLTLPILRESSLNLLSAFLPLFLNREIFENDPFAMFSYLSISGVVMSINPQTYMISNSNFEILKDPVMYMSIFTVISGLVSRNFFVLKLTCVHLIGSFLSDGKSLTSSLYFTFLSIAFAMSLSQLSTRKNSNFTIHPKLESIGFRLTGLFLALYFVKNCIKSTELSPGGYAALQLNDILIAESESCPGFLKAHVSKTAQDLGLSKFSTVKNSKIAYEFGTIYDDKEMLQKFKYRVADINENIDPAYWRVRRVINGISSIKDQKSKLQVKILARAQAE